MPEFKFAQIDAFATRAFEGNPLVPISRWASEKSELMNIGKYYATESMLVWDAVNGYYDAECTPSTGKDTFYDHVVKMRETGSLETVDNDTRLF